MTYQPKIGDKVRVLVARDVHSDEIEIESPYVFLGNSARNGLAVLLKSGEEDRVRNRLVVLLTDIEPWRDEPQEDALAAVDRQLAEKRAEYKVTHVTYGAAASRLNQLDCEIDTLSDRRLELVAQAEAAKFEVGAIVDAMMLEGTRRGSIKRLATGSYEGGYVVDFGNATRPVIPERLRLIFPADHLVAKSLSERTFGANAESGEYRTGDVVEISGMHPRKGETLILGDYRGHCFDLIGTGNVVLTKDARLVTPRELRVDIGTAEGGVWETWFEAEEPRWLPKPGEIVVGHDKGGDAGVTHGGRYTVSHLVGTTHAMLNEISDYSVNLRHLRPAPLVDPIIAPLFEKQTTSSADGIIGGIGPDAPVITNDAGAKQSKSPYRFDLADPKAMFAMTSVLAHGAEKYGDDNWKRISVRDHLNHMLIHAYAYLAGDTSDDHLSHMLCRALFAQAVDITQREESEVNPPDKSAASNAA